MRTKRINGLQFESMVRNGLANLRLMEQTVNDLNVFPVADGDTGTNMCLTLEHGINATASQPSLGLYLKSLSQGMLLGARGNSGVILSQFFSGVYQELSRCGVANPLELRNALIRGYKVAYASMVQPVEGTILTVCREGIEHIRYQLDRNTTMEGLFSMYIAEMKKSLSATPEMLQPLKEAGVVDSGAMGFIIITEGMLKCLFGEIIATEPTETPAPKPVETFSAFFHENSVFEKGYCLEFVLQLMKDEKYDQRFRLNTFTSDLQDFGDSLAVVMDDTRVKVHIHTKKPAKVIALAQEFGEFLTFKLENMQLQHNEHLQKQAGKKKKLAMVAVVNGEGMKQLFLDLGCDMVIEGGSTMNTSSQEFMDVFAQLNAETIVVLPNHKNVVLAAQQAISLSGRQNVQILPTSSMVEGYFAMAMDVADSDDTPYRISQMEQGANMAVTLSQTTASRDYSYHEISCRAGEEIVLLGHELVCVGSDWLTTIVQGLQQVPNIEDKETCVVFRGQNVEEDLQWALEEALQNEFPLLEVSFLHGGQDVYDWILGIS